MKRLAVYIAAQEVVAAFRDLREYPGVQAEQRLEGCIVLLSLRLEVYERWERALAERRGHAVSQMFKPLPTEKERGRLRHAPPAIEEEAM